MLLSSVNGKRRCFSLPRVLLRTGKVMASHSSRVQRNGWYDVSKMVLIGACGGAVGCGSNGEQGTSMLVSATSTAATSTAVTSSEQSSSAAASTSASASVPGSTAAPSASVPADVPAWGEIYYLINQTCAAASCHVPNYIPPDLSDAKNDLYEILTGTSIMRCAGAPLVVPGDPASSALIQVVKHECGTLVMPLGCTEPICIVDSSLQMLTTWIAAGAPR